MIANIADETIYIVFFALSSTNGSLRRTSRYLNLGPQESFRRLFQFFPI